MSWIQVNSELFFNPFRVLLVIAHPDDEALFFTPFLLACQKLHCTCHILCLSTGNFEGLGETRRIELINSASHFGIDSHNVTIIDHAELQDGMNNSWKPETISEFIQDYCKKNNEIQAIVTFDEHGVSNHPNHIAVHFGAKLALYSLNRDSQTNHSIKGFKLITKSLIQKFLGPFELIFSLCSNSNVAFTLNIFHVFRGLLIHKSQDLLYRRVFILFSNHSFVNSFDEI